MFFGQWGTKEEGMGVVREYMCEATFIGNKEDRYY